MNEEEKSELIRFLQGVESRVGKAENFVVEQAPLYVQELLNWQFYGSILMLVVLLGLVLLCFAITSFLYYRTENMVDTEAKGKCEDMLLTARIIVIVIAALFTVSNVYALVKSVVAPRVVVVDQLTAVVRR